MAPGALRGNRAALGCGGDGRDGETGRRKGLKIPWAQAHVGSTPTPGMALSIVISTIVIGFYDNIMTVRQRVAARSCRISPGV